MEAQMNGEPGAVATDYWVHINHPPKCLPDVVEAYVGAVFVDSRYDYSTVQAFFDAHIRPWFEDMALYDDFATKHPVTHLARLMQQVLGCGEWRLLVREVAPAAEEAGAACLIESSVACGLLVHGKVVENRKTMYQMRPSTRNSGESCSILLGNLSQWQRHEETRAFAFGALDFDAPVMAQYDLLYQR